MGTIGRTNTGGAGLNLTILASVTQPSNPVENLIWFNTDTTIPHWYFQNDEPSDPALGDVYVTISTTATNVLQTLRNNGMKLYFGTPRQWDGDSWEIIGGKIYYNGEWHNLQTFVYDGSIGNAENNFNHDVGGYDIDSGGWPHNCTYSTYEDRFKLSVSGGYQTRTANTPDTIDFTDVKTVKITYKASSSGGPSGHYFSVYASSATSWSAYSGNLPTSAEKTTAEIDTSALTGKYYLGAVLSRSSDSGSRTVEIYTIELIT